MNEVWARNKQESRNENPYYLIACIGEKTEKHYIEFFKQKFRLPNTFHVKACGSEPRDFLKKVEEYKKNQEKENGEPYKKILLVFDHDNFHHLKNSIDKIKQKKYEYFISNPSIEYWFLLHYKYTTKEFENANKCEKELKKCYPNYQKNNLRDFLLEIVESKTECAIKNAINNYKNCETTRPRNQELYDTNPFTNMHELVKLLKYYR